MTDEEKHYLNEVEDLLLRCRLSNMVPVWDYPELPEKLVSSINEEYDFIRELLTAAEKLIALVKKKEN